MQIITRREFHTIDALRFFAFFKVFMLHVPADGDFGLFSYLKRGGGIGVAFFFVLSGFLITYMLSSEKINTGHIALPRFYAKRILRIWPLFYLLVCLMYFLPVQLLESLGLRYTGGYAQDWRYSFLFAENYKIILAHDVPQLGPLLVTWSLCIEEHFYIIWSILFTFIASRFIPYSMGLLAGIAVVTRLAAIHYMPQYDIATNEIITALDFFAGGGIVGYLTAAHGQWLDRMVERIPIGVRWTYILFVVIFVFAHDDLLKCISLPLSLYSTVSSVIFAGLIAMVIPESSPIRISPGNMLSYLGRISYGLYMFHLPVILIWLSYWNHRGVKIDTAYMVTLTFVLTFVMSVILSSALYYFFEKPILRLKRYL